MIRGKKTDVNAKVKLTEPGIGGGFLLLTFEVDGKGKF